MGCAATPAENLSQIDVGMSKSAVVNKLGQPNTTSAKGTTEFLTYITCVAECWRIPGFRVIGNLYVKLVDGKVESFGNKGDFDSTKIPTVRVERDDKVEIKSTGPPDLYTELKKLKDLLDSGVITQEEFDAQKKKLLAK